MKECDHMIKKCFSVSLSKRLCSMLVLFFCFLLLPSCKLLTIEKHRPVLFYDADYAFSDSSENDYFLLNDSVPKRLAVYDKNSTDDLWYYRYRTYCFHDNDGFSGENVASNSNYIFVSGHRNDLLIDDTIKVLNKSFVTIKTISFGENKRICQILCDDNYLYLIINHNDVGLKKLHQIDLCNFEDVVLCGDTSETNHYIDEKTHLFYDNWETVLYSEKTKMLSGYDYDGMRPILYTDMHRLYLTETSIVIEYNDLKTEIDNIYGITQLYFKAYVMDNKLVFAGLVFQPEKSCFFHNIKTACIPCVCGIMESYLFVFDLETDKLLSCKKYEIGTYLINYDTDNTQYYYNGGLYNNGSLVRECEVAHVGETETFSRFSNYKTEWGKRHYHLCYNNGSFYGI